MIGQLPKYPAGTVLAVRDAALVELLDSAYGTGWALLQAGDALSALVLVAADGCRYELGAIASRLVPLDQERNPGGPHLGLRKAGRKPAA